MSWSWLDLIPGARSAYQYIAGQMTAFQTAGIGLRGQLRTLDAWWDRIGPAPHTPEQLAVLNEWVGLRNDTLLQIDRWDAINVVLGPVWQAAQDIAMDRTPTTLPDADPPTASGGGGGGGWSGVPGLGVIPMLVLVKAAGWLIALVVVLQQFFAYKTNHESTIRAFVTRNVEEGTMTPQEGANILREGEQPGPLGQLTDVLKIGVVAVVAVMVLNAMQRSR